MNKDTLIVPLSDMHSGGTTALCPDRFLEYGDKNHTPTSLQVAMHNHFMFCAERILKARKNKRLIIIHNGDAVEGIHHATHQLITHNKQEHINLHVELMNEFKKAVDYQRGDLLYYTNGTEVHTDDMENEIGKELGAVENGSRYVFDELVLTIGNKRIWFTHHGPLSGRGANKGNSLRNWLRDKFYDAINEGDEPPHMIISGHTHDPYWQIYIARYRGKYFPVRGLISPSWQAKTRYAYKIAPVQKNKIGLQYFTITSEGDITDPVELLM